MGQSAGAGAILRLITMGETVGLFRRGIVQSGTPRRGISSEVATKRARRLMQLLAIDPDSADAAERLRAAPADRMVTSQMIIARENARFAETDPAFPPVFDDFGGVEEFSDRIAEAATERKIDFIVGTTREEMHAFFVADSPMATPDPAAVAERFSVLAGDVAAIGAYRLRRPGGSPRELLGDLVTDHRFLFLLIDLAERIAAAGRRAHFYSARLGRARPLGRLPLHRIAVLVRHIFGVGRSDAGGAESGGFGGSVRHHEVGLGTVRQNR